MSNKENYIYVCSACNEVVAAKDKICLKCGKDLGQEITEKELEHILQKGPDKAYTLLVAYFEGRDKDAVISLGKNLVKKFPDSRQAKWATEIIDNAIRLIPKKVKYHVATQKYCSNCKRVVEINKGICECGFNFNEPNLKEIALVKHKRITTNRFIGIIMILAGTIFLILNWPSETSSRDTSMDKFIYGIPALLVLFGIYKLFSGRILRNPTKTPFDSILGDTEDAKDVHDDISYVFCPSCGKQLLKELNYSNCPHCKMKLN